MNIDAARKPVGRLASEIAKILLGKDAATYAPHRTAATRVVVTRTDQMVFTGR
ncbi:uL13 family ribosomal protein, partial [Candidatus Parcubacteria bacterium]|nr:uL13 family ribosomal protein [Candidatus Parcubacteria bacterium]